MEEDGGGMGSGIQLGDLATRIPQWHFKNIFLLVFYNKRNPNRVYLPIEVIFASNQGRMSPPM